MDIQKAKLLLDKVNALLKSVSMDADNISNIEKDLMLSYIRQLYDAVLLENKGTDNYLTNKQAAPKPSKPTVFEIEREEPIPPPPPRRIKVEPVTTYTPPRIIEVPDTLADMSKPAPAPTPPPVIQREVPPPTPPKPQPKPKPRPVPQTTTPDGQEGLFEFKAAKELSEKLSERPIRDLTKAFALNDKLLYANELFGKELVVFNESIRQLNGMQDFAEAKAFLSQLAAKYSWTKGERARIAKDFVKLVRRRFI